MPSGLPFAYPPIRGTEEYLAALDRAAGAAKARGLIADDSRAALILHATEALAKKLGVKLPERARPHGTNRFSVAEKKRK